MTIIIKIPNFQKSLEVDSQLNEVLDIKEQNMKIDNAILYYNYGMYEMHYIKDISGYVMYNCSYKTNSCEPNGIYNGTHIKLRDEDFEVIKY